MTLTSRHPRPLLGLLLALAVGAAGAQTASTPPHDIARAERWHRALTESPVPGRGCFRAQYPAIVWETVECAAAPAGGVHPIPRRAPDEAAQLTGDGLDYALGARGLLASATGSFPTVSSVTSETGVGVALFGGKGILGRNEYTLQLNSNLNATTAACDRHAGCVVWQQALYATDYIGTGRAAVFFQYWLLGYGPTCPAGWARNGTRNCYRNSPLAVAPDVAITQLSHLRLTVTALAGGYDRVTFSNGTQAVTVTEPDSLLDIATVWTQAEFNVLGNAGGSRATFNAGASVTVRLAVQDGSTSAPLCLHNAGTAGESNNLTLRTCTATSGTTPAITFTESD